MTELSSYRRAIVLLVILTLVWGTNWPLFPLAVKEVSVWTFRAVSCFGAGCALLVIASARGDSLRVPREAWLTLFLAAMSYLLIWNIASTYSAILIPSGQAAVLGFTMPLWASLISWLMFGERIRGRMLFAIALGAAAVVLLILPSLGSFADTPFGFAMGLLSAIGWAVGTLVLKRRPVAIPIMVMAGWLLLISGVPITLMALYLAESGPFMPSWQSIAAIAYITFIPMTIGNACWFAVSRILPAHIAGLSSIMVPIVAMISGAIVHSEPLGPSQIAAMLCCMLALKLAMSPPKPAAVKTA